jgi:hypothetical protein
MLNALHVVLFYVIEVAVQWEVILVLLFCTLKPHEKLTTTETSSLMTSTCSTMYGYQSVFFGDNLDLLISSHCHFAVSFECAKTKT